jgi:proton glutamate symport protein
MFVGLELGHDLPEVGAYMKICSKIFIRLIKTIIAPIIFATLVVGIAGHASIRQVGRMGWKSILYFEIVTTIALFIGLAAINISGAGIGITIPEEAKKEQLQVTKQSAEDIILHIFPENIAKSIAEGQVLQIVVFSILFAIGLALVKEAKRKPMLDFCESLAEVMFKFTKVVMYFAPVGVGAAIAYTVSHMGVGVLVNLFQLLATLYAALLVLLLFVLLPIALLVKVPMKKFMNAIAEPVSIAFATTSSEAALPKALENMEKFGVPRKIVSFVLPTLTALLYIFRLLRCLWRRRLAYT